MKKKTNYLGLDWGTVNVGVALAHQETRVALAYATLANDAHLLRRLGDMIVSENIGTVVIGIAQYVHRDAEDKREQLGELLGKRCAVTVEYQNEMFTTKTAQENLMERGGKGISKRDDAEAARIILQEWLDAHR